jgi:hypothetical protein
MKSLLTEISSAKVDDERGLKLNPDAYPYIAILKDDGVVTAMFTALPDYIPLWVRANTGGDE